MTKLEKIGLIVGIPSGAVTVLEYMEKINFIKFLRENAEWIPLAIKTLIIWLYENIILLQVNIWIMLGSVWLSYRLVKFIKNKTAQEVIKNEFSYLKFFNSMSKNEQIVFSIAVNQYERGQISNLGNISSSIKNKYNISNLELTQLIESLENKKLIVSTENVYEISFNLTKFGRDLAVELINKEIIRNQ